MKLKIFLSALSLSLALAADSPRRQTPLDCHIERVSNCVGDVPYHCGGSSYQVVCATRISTNSYEDALVLEAQLQGKSVKYYVDNY